MRIRLTLDIERRRPEPEQGEDAPQIDHKGSFILERADPHPEPDRPIGFRRGDDE